MIQKQLKRASVLIIIFCCTAMAVVVHANDTGKIYTTQEMSKLLGGTTDITLHLKDVTPLEFYTELWKQTSLPPFTNSKSFKFWKEPSTISIDVDHATFWEVIRQVARKYGVSVSEQRSAQANNGTGEPILNPNSAPGETVGQAFSDGPFLLTINKIEYSYQSSIRFPSDKEQPTVTSTLGLIIRIFSDLKYPLMQYGTKVTVTKALTDKGVSLLEQTPFTGTASGFDTYQAYFPVPLVPQPDNGGKISVLKGTMDVVIPMKTATWKIDDLANATDLERGTKPLLKDANALLDNVSYHAVKNIKTTDNGISFDLVWMASHPPMSQTGLIGYAMNNNRLIKVVDDKGNALKHGGYVEGMFASSDPISKKLEGAIHHCTYTRTKENNPDGPITLIWDYPTDFRTVEMPFEFTDLPLP